MKKVLVLLLVCSIMIAAFASCSLFNKDTKKETSDTVADTAADIQVNDNVPKFNYSEALDDNGCFKGVKALDYVTLCEYKGINIPKDISDVSDEDVDSQIDAICSSYKTNTEVMDRAIQDADTVNISYVGTIDGKEFQGGSVDGTEVTIGVTSYIDDFIEQLIGHMPGDNFDVNVTFPENYDDGGDNSVNGKDAVFNTTINFIVGDEIIPEFNDEFVKEKLSASYGVETAEELKNQIIDSFRTSQVRAFIDKFVVENSEVKEVPDDIYQYQVDTMIAYYQNYADSYGVSLEEFLAQYVNTTYDDLITEYEETNKDNAKLFLVYQAIYEDCKDIEVTDENTKAYFESVGYSDYSDIVSNYGQPYVNLVVFNNLIDQYLYDNAVYEDASAAPETTTAQ